MYCSCTVAANLKSRSQYPETLCKYYTASKQKKKEIRASGTTAPYKQTCAGVHRAWHKSCQASSTDRCDILSQRRHEKIIQHIFQSYLDLPRADASAVRLVIHVSAMMPGVVTVPVAIALPSYPPSFPFPCNHDAPIIPGEGGCSHQQRLGWIMHISVSAVWISPPPHTHTHTPLNASLLLQHIIFADHKIHPQHFPGRTWH